MSARSGSSAKVAVSDSRSQHPPTSGQSVRSWGTGRTAGLQSRRRPGSDAPVPPRQLRPCRQGQNHRAPVRKAQRNLDEHRGHQWLLTGPLSVGRGFLRSVGGQSRGSRVALGESVRRWVDRRSVCLGDVSHAGERGGGRRWLSRGGILSWSRGRFDRVCVPPRFPVTGWSAGCGLCVRREQPAFTGNRG
jgi:hypothetical protein